MKKKPSKTSRKPAKPKSKKGARKIAKKIVRTTARRAPRPKRAARPAARSGLTMGGPDLPRYAFLIPAVGQSVVPQSQNAEPGAFIEWFAPEDSDCETWVVTIPADSAIVLDKAEARVGDPALGHIDGGAVARSQHGFLVACPIRPIVTGLSGVLIIKQSLAGGPGA